MWCFPQSDKLLIWITTLSLWMIIAQIQILTPICFYLKKFYLNMLLLPVPLKYQNLGIKLWISDVKKREDITGDPQSSERPLLVAIVSIMSGPGEISRSVSARRKVINVSMEGILVESENIFPLRYLRSMRARSGRCTSIIIDLNDSKVTANPGDVNVSRSPSLERYSFH